MAAVLQVREVMPSAGDSGRPATTPALKVAGAGVVLCALLSCGGWSPVAASRELPPTRPQPSPRPSSTICSYGTWWTVQNAHRGPLDDLQTIVVSTSILPETTTIVYQSQPLRQWEKAGFHGPSGLTLHASFLKDGLYYHSSAHASDECPGGVQVRASWTYTGEAVMTTACVCT